MVNIKTRRGGPSARCGTNPARGPIGASRRRPGAWARRRAAARTRREAGGIRLAAGRLARRPGRPRRVAQGRCGAGAGPGGVPARNGAVAANAKVRHVHAGPGRSVPERHTLPCKSCCRGDLARGRLTYPGGGQACAGCAAFLRGRGGAKPGGSGAKPSACGGKPGRVFLNPYAYRRQRIIECQITSTRRALTC
jgi:hypothetical protein